MEFITLDEYKTFSGISSTNQDLVLTPKIEFVNDFVTNYLGIISSTIIELDSSIAELLPSNLPIATTKLISLTDFTEDTTFDATKYYQFSNKLRFKEATTGILEITFDTDKYIVPSAVKEACLQLVKYYVKEEYKVQQQQGSEQINTSEPKSLPIYIKNILDLYREI